MRQEEIDQLLFLLKRRRGITNELHLSASETDQLFRWISALLKIVQEQQKLIDGFQDLLKLSTQSIVEVSDEN